MKSGKILVVLSVLLFLPYILQIPSVHCELQRIDEKALAYIENVLSIDFSHYQITNNSYELPDAPNATYRTDAVTFTLSSSDSLLFVNCMFQDGVQYTCDMRVQYGSPVYVRDCSNLIDVARFLIEGHQNQLGVDCSYLLKMLDGVTTTDNVTTVTLGNLKLVVSKGLIPIGLITVNGTMHVDSSKTHSSTTFNWACDDHVIFFIDFECGHLHSLRDERIINNFNIIPVEDSLKEDSTVEQNPPEQSESEVPNASDDGTSMYANNDQIKTEAVQSGCSSPVSVAIISSARARGVHWLSNLFEET